MHKIFYGRRCLLICGQNENVHGSFIDLSSCNYADLMTALTSDDKGCDIIVTAGNPDSAYEAVCAFFKQVNAAGGLVRDTDGKSLMIHRNGVWDLPKGHQEAGEDIKDTAAREILEETGVSGLIMHELACITHHCYFRNGIWHLKHTWWFNFDCPAGTVTVPQTEEGISEVAWVPENELPEHLAGSYPSIREVFASTMKLFV